MILWFVASAIATAAAFLAAPDRRGPAALALRGLAVAVGTLALVLLPYGLALSARWGGSELTALSHAVALATARALLTENAALILLGNLFGIALAAWLRVYDGIATPTTKLLSERLTLILAVVLLVAIGLPWLSANKDRIGSVEIASLAKLTLQPAQSAQIQNVVSSASDSAEIRTGIDIAQYVSFARDFTTGQAIQRDVEAAAILPGSPRARPSGAVATSSRPSVAERDLPVTTALMARLDPLLACVEAYVGDMRDYRLFLVDVRPLLLELHRIRGFQAYGDLPIHAVWDLESAARVLAGEAAWRLAARRSRTAAVRLDHAPEPCRERTAVAFDRVLHSNPASDERVPLGPLDQLNPYPVIVLAYLYGAIGSHATAVDELLAYVDRIRDALVRRPDLSGHRPLLLWFSLRAVIEASVLAEQDAAQPQKAEMMRRLLTFAVDLAREAGAPEPWDFAARCRSGIDPTERRIAFTLLTLRARLLQAAAAAGRTGAAEHAEAARLAAIDLEACFAPLFADRRDDTIRSVAATLQVTRARLALAWSAAARSDRRITDDEARSLARGARDGAMAAIIVLEDLTRQDASPIRSRAVAETDGLASRLRRTAHEARLAEARTTLQQALALAH